MGAAVLPIVLFSSLWPLVGGEAPLPDPIPIRRVLILPGRVPIELERARQGILVQQPRAEFEAAVRAAAHASERGSASPRLVEAHYQARLEGNALIGSAVWTLLPGSSGILPLPSLNLALSRVKVSARDAVLGDLDGKTLGLLVEKGDKQVAFNWSLRGGQEAEGLHFDLQIPACAVASLDLTLPVEATLGVSRTTAALSGPLDAGDPRERLWKLRFTGRSALDFVIRAGDKADRAPPRYVARVVATQQLAPARVHADFDVQVEVLHRPTTELTFALDRVLEPYEVSLRNVDLKGWQFAEEPARPAAAPHRLLRVMLREPFQGPLPSLQIRCLAHLPADKPWTSPWLRLRDAVVQGETLKLHVHPEVRLMDWQPGGLRLVGLSTAKDGSQTLTLEGTEGSSPLPRPAARVKTQGVDFLARQRTWWKIGPHGSSLIADISYEVSRGSLIELPLVLPAGWQVDEVSVEPKHWLRTWVPGTAGGRPTVVVELQHAVTARQEVRVTLGMHASLGRDVLAAGKDLAFPELGPFDPCVRENTLAISVDPLFEARVTQASVPAAAPEPGGPWGGALPSFSFNSRNRPVTGSLQLKPRPPVMRSVCQSEFVLAPATAGVLVKVELEGGLTVADRLEMRFSAPLPPGGQWKGVSRPDLIREATRLPGWGPGRFLLPLAPPHLATLASGLLVPDPGERWRITLNLPVGRREILSFQGTLQQSGKKRSGNLLPAWDWQLPLVTVPSAERTEGQVSLHLAGTELLALSPANLHGGGLAGLGEPSGPHDATEPARTFHYSSRSPALGVRARAVPAERMGQESCERALLVSRLEPDGKVVHAFSFVVGNWRQRVLPVRLPAGATLLGGWVDGCWIGQLSAVTTADALEVALPGIAGEGFHRLSLVYTIVAERPFLAPGASLGMQVPALPIPPLSVRRVCLLPPGTVPLSDKGLHRLPDNLPALDHTDWWDPLQDLWQAGSGWNAELLGQSLSEDDAFRNHQTLESAETALRKSWPGGQSLGMLLRRLAQVLSRTSSALVVDAIAFRSAGLEPDQLVKLSGPDPHGAWRPFWEDLGLTTVSGANAVLLTTRRQAEAWSATGGNDEPRSAVLETALQEARLHGQDASGRFCLAWDWAAALPADRRTNDPAHEALVGVGQPWTAWELLPGAAGSLRVVNTAAINVLGCLLAGLLLLLAVVVRRRLSARKRFRGLIAWLALAGLAVIWFPASVRPLAWGTAGAAISVALVWYARKGKPPDRPSSVNSLSADGKRMAVGAVATAVGFLLLIPWSAALSQGRPEPPDPSVVFLLPESATQPQMALVPPPLLTRLKELTESGTPSARGAVPISAVYEGKLSEGRAEFRADFQVFSFADQAALRLPLGPVELNEGATVDGRAVYPTALPAPQTGYALPLTGRGMHQVSLLFAARTSETGEQTEVSFAVPPLPQSRLTLELPPGALSAAVMSALGAQKSSAIGSGAVRLEADLGREGTVHARWRHASRSPRPLKLQVRESYLWDLRQPIPLLTAVLRYLPSSGAAGRLALKLPDGVEVRTVEAAPAEVATEAEVPVRLKTWRVTGAGGNRQLQVELQTPLSGPFLLTVGLVLERSAGHRLLLALPIPLDAQPAEGFLGYQLPGGEVLDKRLSLFVINLSPTSFVQSWKETGMPDPGLPTRAYTFRRTPGGLSALALTVLPSRPQATEEVTWQIQPGYADVRIKASLKSPRNDLMLVEWQVPTDLVVAEVRGPEVDHWSRTAQRLQVWLREPRLAATVELTGWMAFPWDSATRDAKVSLPALSLNGVEFGGATVRILAAPQVELEVENLQDLTPLALPGQLPLSLVAKQPGYRAGLHIRPAAAPVEARTFTRAEIKAGQLTFVTHVNLQVPAGPAREITLQVRGWGDNLRLETLELPPPRAFAGRPDERSWKLSLPTGGNRRYQLRLHGTSELEQRKRSMPEVTVAGAAQAERWVAVSGPELTAADPQGLTPVPNLAQELRAWPAEAEALRRAGAVWRVAEPSWRLWLLPRATAPAPVQVVSAEVEAALAEGQRWIHQATYRLLAEGPYDLDIHLPAGALLFGLTLDGKTISPLRPTPEALRVRLSRTAGPGVLRVRWSYAPGKEREDQPDFTSLTLVGLKPAFTNWALHLPPLSRARPDGRARETTLAATELNRAEALMRLSVLLAQRKDVATPAGHAQLAQAQAEFFAHLRRAEYEMALTPEARTVVRPQEQQVRKENARLAQKHGFGKIRADAEKQSDFGSAERSDPLLALTDLGTSTYWLTDVSGQPPEVRVTRASAHVAEKMLASQLLLLVLVGVLILARFPRVTNWLRLLWPEQLLLLAWIGCELFGVSLLGILLFTAGLAMRLAWLAKAARRLHEQKVA
jgi:hypothetical protein